MLFYHSKQILIKFSGQNYFSINFLFLFMFLRNHDTSLEVPPIRACATFELFSNVQSFCIYKQISCVVLN